jgi:hypothetical protein
MRTHEKLEVWKKSIEAALIVYRVTESFPKEERFGFIHYSTIHYSLFTIH